LKKIFELKEDPFRFTERLVDSPYYKMRAGRFRVIMGIDDTIHTIVDTRFDPYSTKGKGNQDLLLWLSLGLHPNVGFEATVVDHPEGRLILFTVTAAWVRPVKFYGPAYIRVGSSKTELSKHPELERAIWTIRTDWSAQICETATIEDLDPVALTHAREEFITKHPDQADRDLPGAYQRQRILVC
jgi:ATP-dependent DNA helicase RecG